MADRSTPRTPNLESFKSFISFTLFDLIATIELPCDIVSVNTLRGAQDLKFSEHLTKVKYF